MLASCVKVIETVNVTAHKSLVKMIHVVEVVDAAAVVIATECVTSCR